MSDTTPQWAYDCAGELIEKFHIDYTARNNGDAARIIVKHTAAALRSAAADATRVAWNQCADIVEGDLERSQTDWQAVVKRMRRTARMRAAEPERERDEPSTPPSEGRETQ